MLRGRLEFVRKPIKALVLSLFAIYWIFVVLILLFAREVVGQIVRLSGETVLNEALPYGRQTVSSAYSTRLNWPAYYVRTERAHASGGRLHSYSKPS